MLGKILQKVVLDYISKGTLTSRYVRPDYLGSTFADEMGWFTRSVLSAVMYSVFSNLVVNQSKKQKE